MRQMARGGRPSGAVRITNTFNMRRSTRARVAALPGINGSLSMMRCSLTEGSRRTLLLGVGEAFRAWPPTLASTRGMRLANGSWPVMKWRTTLTCGWNTNHHEHRQTSFREWSGWMGCGLRVGVVALDTGA